MTTEGILARNNVSVIGEGDETLIFAHGFGCSQNTWSEVANALQSQYRIVLFDYVGAGRSDLQAYHSDKYGSLEGYARDVIDVCHALKINRAVLIGHSVSCMIGVIAAIKEPQLFSNLIFVSPSPYFFNDGNYVGGLNRDDLDGLFEMMNNNYLGWSSMMAPLIMGNPERPELGDKLAASFCATDPVIAKEFARVTFYSDNRKYLPLLHVDSLTLQCQEDMLAPASVGEYIRDNTHGNRLMQLRARGHCPHLSAAQEVIAAIRTYLADTSRQSQDGERSYGQPAL